MGMAACQAYPSPTLYDKIRPNSLSLGVKIMRPPKLIFFLLLNLLITACGQIGPLYLPDKAPPNQTGKK